MQNNSQFDSLAKALDEKERKELLQKIKRDKEDRGIEETEISDEALSDTKNISNYERQLKIARNIYSNETMLAKIVIFIIAIFTGKKREEVILKRLFNDLKREINAINSEIVDFDSSIFTTAFLEEIEKLAEAASRLLPIFEKFFSDTNLYNNFISSVLEKRFDDEIKNLLLDLNPEKYDVNLAKLDKEEFQTEKKRRINAFIKKLSFFNISELNQQLTDFEIFIRTITFDYKAIMYYFSHNNQSVHKNLSGIKFNVIEPILEKLLVILNSINFEYEQISFIEEIIGFKNNNEPTEEPLFFTETDIENIKYIFNIIKQFLSRVPLTKIFQYFKQNLLYKPNKLNLKSDFLTIYKNLKRNETDILWDKHYEKLLEKNRKRLITELFGEYNFDTLENFNLNLSNMINKSSNVKIRFVKKINILTEFITRIYKTEIEKIINKILIDGSFTKESHRSNLSSAYYLLRNITERIKNFDKEFEEENNFGRKLSLHHKITTGEIDYAKSLQNTIIEINEITEALLSEAVNALNHIRLFTSNLLEVPTDINLHLINFESIRIPGFFNPYQAMSKVNNYFNTFFEVFNNMEDF